MEIQAQSRLNADAAHSSWFDSLSADQQAHYLELHPHSKFAQEKAEQAEKGAQPSDKAQPEEKKLPHKVDEPKGGQSATGHGGEHVHQTHAEDIKHLDTRVQKFFAEGGTKPGSSHRKKAAAAIKNKAGAIFKAFKENSKEWKVGALAMGKLAKGGKLTDHEKEALKATVKDALTITAYVGLGGGLTHGVGMALAHFGTDLVKDLVLKSTAHGLVHGALVLEAGAAEDKMLKNLIAQIAEMVENGDIPDSVWENAIKAESKKAKAKKQGSAKPNSVAALSASFSAALMQAAEITAAPYSNELEDTAFDFFSSNYSLEHGNISFMKVQQDAQHGAFHFTAEDVGSREFRHGVDRAVNEQHSALRMENIPCHDLVK